MEKKSLRQQYTEIIMGKREDDEDEMYEMFLQSLTLRELEELATETKLTDEEL
jgi:hypothetical protein